MYIEEAVGYVRCSHQEQKLHGLSLDAQVQKIEEYAKANNLKIVGWYRDEGVSARKKIEKRPELQRMIKDAQLGRFKRILFIRLDRYFRSIQEYYACQKILDEAGVVWTATEEKYSLADANGRAFVNMKLTIAELEADTTGDRIKIVNEYKVKSGMPLYGAQCFPFCYTVQQVEGEKHKTVVKQHKEVMEDAIAHVMVNHSVGAALVYIKNKHGMDVSYNSLMGALKNEMICGSYRGNPNYCEPYITREMFDKLQTYITHVPRNSGREHTYLFSGLIPCPSCGRVLTGTFHVTKRGDKRYIYYGYRCNKAKKDKTCAFKTVVFENRLEQFMLERIEPLIEEKELRDIEIGEAEKVSKYDVKELEDALDRLNYAWKKGRIKSVEEYDRDYEALVSQIEAAKEEKTEAPKDYTHIKAILESGWKGIYNALDAEHKRTFWRSLVKAIYITWNKDIKQINDVDFF